MSGEAAALIPAAGLARRFGADKLSAPFRGRALLDHVVAAAGAAGLAPIIVVARRAGALAGARVIVNDDPSRGLSSSLRLGLGVLEEISVRRAIVLLGDQPLVSVDVILRLLAEAADSSRPIVVPRYADGGPGNPVLLERAAWPLAATLTGDRGMSALFGARPELVRYVDVEGANPDVDTPADLAALDASPSP